MNVEVKLSVYESGQVWTNKIFTYLVKIYQIDFLLLELNEELKFAPGTNPGGLGTNSARTGN